MSLERLIWIPICALAIFFLALMLGKSAGLEQPAVATICSAAALATSAIVAFMAFQLNRRTAQEPWLVTFRELHKEFWNDDKMAKVRSWLSCDEAYRKELLPVLQKRASGQISSEQYTLLETLDRFCALMLRLVHVNTQSMTADQLKVWKSLGYYYWLYLARGREELRAYIEKHWEHLHPHVRDATFHNS